MEAVKQRYEAKKGEKNQNKVPKKGASLVCWSFGEKFSGCNLMTGESRRELRGQAR